MKDIGRRDDYITATLPTQSYDEDGRLVTSGSTTIEFWGNIDDVKSDLTVGGGKRRDARMIKIEVDSRDVEDLTIDYTLTYGGSSDRFQVVDIFDSDFRFTSMVIAQYIK